MEKQPHTQQTIYGLHTGKEYEVHIRSRMQAFVKFGEFSDSVFIKMDEIPHKGKESGFSYQLDHFVNPFKRQRT